MIFDWLSSPLQCYYLVSGDLTECRGLLTSHSTVVTGPALSDLQRTISLSSKYLKVFENIWKYLKILENIWCWGENYFISLGNFIGLLGGQWPDWLVDRQPVCSVCSSQYSYLALRPQCQLGSVTSLLNIQQSIHSLTWVRANRGETNQPVPCSMIKSLYNVYIVHYTEINPHIGSSSIIEITRKISFYWWCRFYVTFIKIFLKCNL